ncbi:heparinase II/III domain-containing protein [Streptomyces sp. NBC_00588]|uniref:heparinase II/III domain-containing protein n=1 Tax=Streptomyces sp. NBC_00588 TaxID=2975784 RepID=UPI002E80BC2A|nr:heparinase II/III family protein [Streptomyces sp. NBC_00588]WUB34694.1 heparinase II/III-family protein [Streptomyces sp. NBC_00588]
MSSPQKAEGAAHPLLTRLFPPTLVAARMPRIGEWSPVPSLKDRDRWQAIDRAARDRILETASASLGQPWPDLPASLFARFARDGDRSEYQDRVFARRARLARAVLAAAVSPGTETSQGAFIDEVMDGVWALCEETSWVWPAHDFRVLGPEHGLLADPDRPTLDLGASGTAVLLALTDAIVGDELDRLDPLVRRRLRREVSTRVLRPYLERDEWGWYDGSTAKLNNWNPWIHSELLLTTALTEESDDHRTALVCRILQGLENYLRAHPRDGGCDEGPHYWWRAGASLFECLETLTSLLGTDAGVFGHPLVRAMARYPVATWIGDGWAVNFADGPARPRETAPALLYRYGRRTDQPEVSAHARALREDTGDGPLTTAGPFDLRRTLDALLDTEWNAESPASFPLPARSWLPDTQVLVARTRAASERGLLVAAKAGHNDESHNHNDVGTFIIAVDTRPLVIDAGVGTYRRETFNDRRYSIWSMTSEYHNVPVVNGLGQRPGPGFRASSVTAHSTAETDEITCDLAPAYPPQAQLESWMRTVRLVRGEDERAEIEDAWQLRSPSSELALHLLIAGDLTIHPEGRATVRPRNRRGLLLTWDPGAFSAEAETIPLTDPAFTHVWGSSVHRLVLTARHATPRGSHTLTARALEAL